MHRQHHRPILVFGSGGQVGRALGLAVQEQGSLIPLDRSAVDLEDHQAIDEAVRLHRPTFVINAAAYTAVDRAESEPRMAEAINAIAPGVIARAAHAVGACMVHYSTDYVFDGTKDTPYVESDEPAPLSVYGRTKLMGEIAVARECPRSAIFRTSWVFGVSGNNFVRTMIRLAGEREELRIVSDQVGAPTSAALIAEVTLKYLRHIDDGAESAESWGVHHLTARGAVSWANYARHVITRARTSGFQLKATPDSVTSISSAEFGAVAMRPANSLLDTSKIRALLGTTLPEWQRDVDRAIALLRDSTST